MPNWCSFNMTVAGRRDHVDTFIKVLQNDYDKVHLFRISEAEVDKVQDYGYYRKVWIWGECAWSVICCMFPGPFTYYDRYIAEAVRLPNIYEMQSDYSYKYGGKPTHLLDLSNKLGLQIEINSTEPDMCFQEYFKVVAGQMVSNKLGNYQEFWIDEYDTYDEAIEEWPDWKDIITKEEFDEVKASDDDTIIKKDWEPIDTIPAKPVNMIKTVLYKLIPGGSNNNE